MSETKTGKGTPAKSAKAKTGKADKTTARPTSPRAAAVDKNLGGSQSLRDFLNGVGWR
jgi:hypothetical protein